MIRLVLSLPSHIARRHLGHRLEIPPLPLFQIWTPLGQFTTSGKSHHPPSGVIKRTLPFNQLCFSEYRPHSLDHTYGYDENTLNMDLSAVLSACGPYQKKEDQHDAPHVYKVQRRSDNTAILEISIRHNAKVKGVSYMHNISMYYAVPLNAKFALDGAHGLRHVPIIRCS
jgi:hypothetical protein